MFQAVSIPAALVTVASAAVAFAEAPPPGDSPADHLPSHITRLTSFGERADWSHDGRRILFLSKTFGDALEIDLATRQIRNLTAHYPHHGYTRALYLANGDLLLSGPHLFDARNPAAARRNCFLFVLRPDAANPATPLGISCSEGPAVSRSRLHIAWTTAGYAEPDRSWISVADLEYDANDTPRLAKRKVILDSKDMPFPCNLETQNFRPPDERELIFSAYARDADRCEVCGVHLATKRVTNYTKSPDEYDEPEGIFPDGTATLVECDRQNRQGSRYVDVWKLALDGSGRYERLVHFSDHPGYKSSNPVVSDDGRFIAFQLAKSGDAAGVGHGIFIYDVSRAEGVKQAASGGEGREASN
jgi:hypothetical protein